MRKTILLLIMSTLLLSGCGKMADEKNVYYDDPMMSYALIVLSKETNMPTSEFTLQSSKVGIWEWEDAYYKFVDFERKEYIVKIYENDLDYTVKVDGESIIDTSSLMDDF